MIDPRKPTGLTKFLRSVEGKSLDDYTKVSDVAFPTEVWDWNKFYEFCRDVVYSSSFNRDHLMDSFNWSSHFVEGRDMGSWWDDLHELEEPLNSDHVYYCREWLRMMQDQQHEWPSGNTNRDPVLGQIAWEAVPW